MTVALNDPPYDVEAAFAALSPEVALALRSVRTQILRTAQELEGVGPIHETLKWGEPAYLTQSPKSGTTLRLGQVGGSAAIFVPCSTTIIEDARAIFGDVSDLSGKRGLILGGDGQMLDHVIRAALTYHSRKRVSGATRGGPDRR
ncbi:hypothetical protein [Litoreibacter arenae]|uniref:YdhG-like domain-containing protein n=1 Tax=Litoreibacter arenae DSM 19593 TaxID=1123360 RepID=S9QJV5_9RHOB|nr:hypothetical protein [Litoreibacter arenae]EPX79883.1 hypothetical protein thalar_01219 [Litoreibacter arenae DSM 19593]